MINDNVQRFIANSVSTNKISINRDLIVAWEGDYDMAVFTSQCIFWSNGQSKLGSGVFYKSDADFGSEIYKSRDQVKRMKTKLKAHPVFGKHITFAPKKINNIPTTHWRICIEGIANDIYGYLDSMGETAQTIEMAKTPNEKGENAQSIERAKSPNPPLPDPNADTNKQIMSKKKFSDDDFKLAEWMLKKIQEVAPKTKANLDKWADTVRLMRKQDDLSHKEIQDVFIWANKDSFWRVNILSPSKLRDKFAQLHAQMNNGSAAAGGNGHDPRAIGKDFTHPGGNWK